MQNTTRNPTKKWTHTSQQLDVYRTQKQWHSLPIPSLPLPLLLLRPCLIIPTQNLPIYTYAEYAIIPTVTPTINLSTIHGWGAVLAYCFARASYRACSITPQQVLGETDLAFESGTEAIK